MASAHSETPELVLAMLGAILRRRREESGRTMAEAAEAAGISPGFLSEVERGRKEMSIERLAKVATTLGVAVATIYRELAAGLDGMAIYDVMQHIRPEVATICVGMGMSAAAMILAGGAPGKRLALPSARVMIHQGTAGMRGAPSDMEIQLRETLAVTERVTRILAHHSGQSYERVKKDMDRDYFMTAHEAKEYGLIDEVLAPRRGLPLAVAV